MAVTLKTEKLYNVLKCISRFGTIPETGTNWGPDNKYIMCVCVCVCVIYIMNSSRLPRGNGDPDFS